MKIYLLKVNTKFQPANQPFVYPVHNDDYGVEQDFLNYLAEHQELVTADPAKGDWHYLPVFWTRWHLHHYYGQYGREELQAELNRCVIDDSKTFTICQYDDGPVVDVGNTTCFLASRKSARGIDIPLLCKPHNPPAAIPVKKHLASFVGSIATHSIRKEMAEQLKEREDILIVDGNMGTGFFVNRTMESYIVLCPRGYGGSSFRFFEAMQLGAVPFLIGDLDTRPFKKYINWDEISFYASTASKIIDLLNSMPHEKLQRMGENAARVYTEKIKYQRWCSFVIKELEKLTRKEQ